MLAIKCRRFRDAKGGDAKGIPTSSTQDTHEPETTVSEVSVDSKQKQLVSEHGSRAYDRQIQLHLSQAQTQRQRQSTNYLKYDLLLMAWSCGLPKSAAVASNFIC